MADALGAYNPLRYRSYVNDNESGLYYLQSRYYDPKIGRFMNADSYTSTGQGPLGYNMFAYCLNNPISFADAGGTAAEFIPISFEETEEKIEEYLTDSNSYGAIISGASISISLLISSTISAVKSAPRAANIGIGTHAKNVAKDIAYLKGAETAASKAFNYLAYGAVAIDVIYGVNSNIKAGASAEKIVYDASVDVLITGGTIWGAGAVGSQIGTAIGSIFPGAGNAVGAIAGFALGVGIYVLTDMVDYNGKTGREWLKGMVE